MENKKLKIAMLSAHSCPVGDLGAKDTGGMSVYIRELARELGKLGHSVDIYTRIHDPKDPISETLGRNTRLIHLKAGKEAPVEKMAVFSSLPEFIRNLEKHWADNYLSYDIIFTHYWLSAMVGKYLQRNWHIPYISMYHTLGAVKNALNIGMDEPSLRINSEKETVQDCRKIIAATEKEKQDITFYYDALPDKVTVIPCGVNMDLFRPHDKSVARQFIGIDNENIALFVGRIDPLKGIDRLLKAIPEVNGREKLKLIIVGGDTGSVTEIQKLERLARELKISSQVMFQGIVKQEQLPYFYSAADVCVVPSYYESFGLVPLESLACGTPVIATDVGDLRNIIRQGETGIILPDNSPDKIAVALSTMLSKPSYDDESVLAIRASVSNWNWAGVAGKVASEMQSVLDSSFARIS